MSDPLKPTLIAIAGTAGSVALMYAVDRLFNPAVYCTCAIPFLGAGTSTGIAIARAAERPLWLGGLIGLLAGLGLYIILCLVGGWPSI